jgi:hypothetical protein
LTNPRGYRLVELNHLKAPKKDVSAVVGYFAKGFNNLNSITIAFKAKSGTWDTINNVFETSTVHGAVYSGFHNMFLDFKPLLQEYHELFTSLHEGFPLTLIGHAEGGALATLTAVELAEQYPQVNVTLITINTSRKWNAAYASRIDKAVKQIYRWREGKYVYNTEGDVAENNEIWNVFGGPKCCPRPETNACKVGRGMIHAGTFTDNTYFNGENMFGSEQCTNIESGLVMAKLVAAFQRNGIST